MPHKNSSNIGLIPENSNTDKGFWAKTKDGLMWVGSNIIDGAEYSVGTAAGMVKGGLNILGDGVELVGEGLENLYDEGKDFCLSTTGLSQFRLR